MKLQLKKIWQLIPRKYRIWVSLALIAGAIVAQQFGHGLNERAMRTFSGDENGTISGRARVIDGDSIKLNGWEVRMKGIDAPEGQQTCEKNGRTWACGEAARKALASLISGNEVRCLYDEKDKHQRILGLCKARGVELNREMVRRGFAVSYGRFRKEEQEAKAAKRGLWAGKFQRPKAWRSERGIGR